MKTNINHALVLLEADPRVAPRHGLTCSGSRPKLPRARPSDALRWVLSANLFRPLVLIVWLIELAGCTPWSPQNEIERADDLGLVTNQPPPPPMLISSISDNYTESDRNRFVEEWMARSDYLCRQYKDKIIRFSRNTRFATDATSTILSGLATIFTAVGTIHPLTGSATIVSGVGAAAQTDTFAQQSGEVVASAIQTARENQANQIEFNLTYPKDKYNIYRAERDVIEYHNMCSLETALAQIRASLKATAPDAGKTPPAAQGTQAPGGANGVETPSGPPPGLRPPAAALTNTPIHLIPPPGVIQSVEEKLPLPAPPRPLPQAPVNRFSPFEQSLTRRQISQIQAALCVMPADGDLGPHGSKTRQFVRQYLDGRNQLDPRNTSDILTPRIGTFLFEAVDDVGNCANKGFLNTYEVGAFGVPASSAEARNQRASRHPERYTHWLGSGRYREIGSGNAKSDRNGA